jgi:hypothetical protein
VNIFENMHPDDVAKYRSGEYVYGRCICGETELAMAGSPPTLENRCYVAPLCAKCLEALAESFSGGPNKEAE